MIILNNTLNDNSVNTSEKELDKKLDKKSDNNIDNALDNKSSKEESSNKNNVFYFVKLIIGLCIILALCVAYKMYFPATQDKKVGDMVEDEDSLYVRKYQLTGTITGKERFSYDPDAKQDGDKVTYDFARHISRILHSEKTNEDGYKIYIHIDEAKGLRGDYSDVYVTLKESYINIYDLFFADNDTVDITVNVYHNGKRERVDDGGLDIFKDDTLVFKGLAYMPSDK